MEKEEVKTNCNRTGSVNQHGYRIFLDNHFKNELGRRYSLDFAITPPTGLNPIIVRVDYTSNFEKDYPGQNVPKEKQEISILIWWGWLKIKEMIDQNNLPEKNDPIKNPFIVMTPGEEVIDKTICSQIQGAGYLYSPK